MNIDFVAITACGECCVGCKKKEAGSCKEEGYSIWNGQKTIKRQLPLAMMTG